MSRIRVLAERVANQIAAGEVVERPAAAVKELVENALDAGATRISVEFRGGGAELIRVEDDGCGMDRDDALLALQRHATSKISEAEDLNRLASFGFRGEALPSIASVSRFVLRTRVSGQDGGTEVLVDAGKLLAVRDCGRPPGTSVEVAHLFHPVPARRRFLKSEATESAHIVQAVRWYALAFPGVRFALTQDGREVFRSPACASLTDRVGEIFGRELAARLAPIDAADPAWRLSGLIGRPGVERAGRQELVMFVNARPVESRTLGFAVMEGYRESLPKGKYPAAFLFLTCDPAAVDVNVHPTKREVRFRQEAVVRDFVVRSVAARLRELAGEAARAAGVTSRPPALEGTAGPSVGERPPGSSGRFLAGEGTVEVVRLAGGGTNPPEAGAPAFGASSGQYPEHAGADRALAENGAAEAVDAWRWVGMLRKEFAVFDAPGGMVLLDRRAAAERVWYERLKGGEGSVASQGLLLPVGVELDPIGSALLVDHRSFLAAQGFEVAEFGRNYFRIEAVPDWLEPGEAEDFLRELLAAARDGRLSERHLAAARDAYARLAAIRAASRPIEPAEASTRRLLAELFGTSNPLSTPGGRPTFVEMGWAELGRRFDR